MFPVRYVSVHIHKPVSEVYKYASEPENLPHWASGLSGSTIRKEGKYWLASAPMGEVKILFTEKNKYGVLDHDVIIASGKVFHNPMRVQHNGNGSELVFTLYRHPGVSDSDFSIDASIVLKDLNRIKEILEAE